MCLLSSFHLFSTFLSFSDFSLMHGERVHELTAVVVFFFNTVGVILIRFCLI